MGILVDSVSHAAQRCKILCIVRYADEFLRINAFGQWVIPLLPNLGNIVLPAITHTLDVGIRSAEQQDHRTQRVAAGEHCQVLLDDGFEKRRHQLVGRNARLL